jgi:hypothetical protein
VYRPTHTDSRKRQSTVLSLIAPPTTCGPASPAEQERIDKDCIASLAKEERLYIDWNVRPATIDDANQTAKLLSDSFYTILPQNYDQDTLTKVLPSITTPRQQLLTCGTWYVVEDPVTKDIVGCGGWTLRSPANSTSQNSTANATAQNSTAQICIAQNATMQNATTQNATTQNATAQNSTDNSTAQNATARDIPVPQLRHFATHPGWTRQGIGKALWKRTWRDISDAVGPETPLEVYSTLTAEPFYASFGFAPVKRVEVTMVKDCPFPVIFMRRESQNSSLSTSGDTIDAAD